METIRALGVNLFLRDGQPYNEQVNDEEDNFLEDASKNRIRTDVPFLILHIILSFLLVCVIGYCMANGDIERLTVGYDHCGNVCGKMNKITYNFYTDCTAANMIDRPYFDVDRKICVATCNNAVGRKCFSGTHIPTMGLETIAQDLHICSGELIGLSFLALGFSLIFLLILRYMTAAFVWTAIGGTVVAALSVTGFLWYMTEASDVYTTGAIIASVFTLILILIIIFLRKRIELVIQLLKEAGKAISSMPLIIFEPLLTLIALGVAITTWIYFTLWIESAGVPVMNEFVDKVTFHQNGLIKFCRWYNIFIMLWTVQFIYGCQNMLLAGAISIWYFTRNRANMNSPVLRSATTMLKFHLGTISFGSLLITLIQMLRIAFRYLRQFIRYPLFLCGMCCLYSRIDVCLSYIESLMKYWTRNAYIVTSIYGTPFIESGTKALKLLVENVLRVIAINSIGDFVLFLGKLLVIVASLGVGVVLFKDKPHVSSIWAPLVVLGIVAALIIHCFLAVYEMAVDTIFICFCEDCNLNDGINRPYYMSQGFMQFVENSKIVMKVKDDTTP